MSNKVETAIDGASSDKDAMVKILRRLDDGWTLQSYSFCQGGKCVVPIHLRFRRITRVHDGDAQPWRCHTEAPGKRHICEGHPPETVAEERDMRRVDL